MNDQQTLAMGVNVALNGAAWMLVASRQGTMNAGNRELLWSHGKALTALADLGAKELIKANRKEVYGQRRKPSKK